MESFAELIDKCQRNTAHHRNAVGKLRALKYVDGEGWHRG